MTGSGDMNRRITLQRATVDRNGFNEPVETWGTLAVVWAKKSDVSAAEAMRAQEVGAELTTRFRIRYDSAWADLNPNDRLLFKGVVHNITGVREKDANRWLEVDCVARADIAAQDETSP
jgi:SPP1 family predicted phage head-tail adaptor